MQHRWRKLFLLLEIVSSIHVKKKKKKISNTLLLMQESKPLVVPSPKSVCLNKTDLRRALLYLIPVEFWPKHDSDISLTTASSAC